MIQQEYIDNMMGDKLTLLKMIEKASSITCYRMIDVL
jgi:hypothetical protein